MNILVVAYKFGTEEEIGTHLGLYHYFKEKLVRIVRQGHQVTVVCPYLSYSKKGSTDISGVTIVRTYPPLPSSMKWWPFSLGLRYWYIRRTKRTVLQLVRQQKFDCVYVWQARETGYAVASVKEKLGVPFYMRQITAWLWHFKRTPREVFGSRSWYRAVEQWHLNRVVDFFLNRILDSQNQKKFARMIYEKADKIIFLSQAAIAEGKQLGLDEKKARAFGLAIETDVFYPVGDKRGIQDRLGLADRPTVLFVGRIHFAEKGIGYLLEAIKAVRQKINNVQLVIIGGGPDAERLKKTVIEQGLESTVFYLGKKPTAQLPDYMNAADLMAVPSVWMEAFGRVTIEAMACGLPVVTSDAGASPEINRDGVTGFVVPAKDSAALAGAIIKILSQPDLRTRLGAAARTHVMQEYSYERIIEKMLRTISKAA